MLAWPKHVAAMAAKLTASRLPQVDAVGAPKHTAGAAAKPNCVATPVAWP
jgi:hypothetical protein